MAAAVPSLEMDTRMRGHDKLKSSPPTSVLVTPDLIGGHVFDGGGYPRARV